MFSIGLQSTVDGVSDSFGIFKGKADIGIGQVAGVDPSLRVMPQSLKESDMFECYLFMGSALVVWVVFHSFRGVLPEFSEPPEGASP